MSWTVSPKLEIVESKNTGAVVTAAGGPSGSVLRGRVSPPMALPTGNASERRKGDLAARVGVLVYGVACYALCLGIFAYAAGWISGIGGLTPTALDSQPGAGDGPRSLAVAIDAALLVLFAVQHSVMARPWFKRAWTRLVPAAAERSTYVLFSSVAMIAMFWLWRPIGGVVWDVRSAGGRAAILAVYGAGWALLLLVTFLINHFDLFGLRQVWLRFRGREYSPLPFKTPALYRVVRHPLYVGWLTLFWAAPTMTAAHLLFAAGSTVYILMAIRWEERDLIAAHPEYAQYRSRVGMLLPRGK